MYQCQVGDQYVQMSGWAYFCTSVIQVSPVLTSSLVPHEHLYVQMSGCTYVMYKCQVIHMFMYKCHVGTLRVLRSTLVPHPK
jgi:hypothetical protein